VSSSESSDVIRNIQKTIVLSFIQTTHRFPSSYFTALDSVASKITLHRSFLQKRKLSYWNFQ